MPYTAGTDWDLDSVAAAMLQYGKIVRQPFTNIMTAPKPAATDTLMALVAVIGISLHQTIFSGMLGKLIALA